MSDAWDSAARRIIAKREQDEHAAAEEAARAHSEAAAKKEAHEQAYRHMEAVIDEVAPQLEVLLRERGEAAMRLLAARNNSNNSNSYIYFGGEQEGGGFVSYCFTDQGLQVVHGRIMGYESVNDGARTATAREVVAAFAYRGGGHRQPDAVRDVVNWFVRQIDQYAT